MKRILGLAALLGQALTGLASSYGIQAPQYRRQYGVKRTVRQGYRLTAPPTAVRWWHDPKDFNQSNTLEAAEVKRQRRACKLHNIHARGWTNPAHRVGYEFSPTGRIVGFTIPASLSPTYVAK